MNERRFKLVQWLLYVLMAISALLTVIFYFNRTNPDLILYWGYILVIFSGLITLYISVMNLIKNPKGSLKVLVIVVGMVIIGIIAYALSDNTLTPAQLEKYHLSPNRVRLIGAGLMMTYVIMIGAVGVFIYTSLFKFFK
jgi:hypothetical protein